VSTPTSKYADRVKPQSGNQPASVEQVAAAVHRASRPIYDELRGTVTRLFDEHSQAVNGQIREAIGSVADIVVKHVARELTERDEVIRRLTERVAALEAATAAR
jgi:hypothetical protein